MSIQSRLYVDAATNNAIDIAHAQVMAHCGYKMPKGDFIATVLKIGLSNMDALYAAYPKASGN